MTLLCYVKFMCVNWSYTYELLLYLQVTRVPPNVIRQPIDSFRSFLSRYTNRVDKQITDKLLRC